MNRIAGLTEETVVSKIYIIRGIKVMLDSDLSLLYGIETKVLKQSEKGIWKDSLKILCLYSLRMK